MAKNRIVVRNASGTSAMVVKVRSLFDGAVLAAFPLPARKTGAVPVAAGAAVVQVFAGTGKVPVWTGAVPADGGAPVEVHPLQRRATYRGRLLPDAPIIERFRMLNGGAGRALSPRLVACAVAALAAAVLLAWYLAKRGPRGGSRRK